MNEEGRKGSNGGQVGGRKNGQGKFLNHPRAVTKDDKIEEVWKGYTVSRDYQLDIRVTTPHQLASRRGIYIVRASW